MAKPTLKSLRLSAASGRLIARLIRRVERTSRLVAEPADLTDRLYSHHPAIIAFWHGQFMMISALNPHGAPVKAMVAKHGDAELIGKNRKLGVFSAKCFEIFRLEIRSLRTDCVFHCN